VGLRSYLLTEEREITNEFFFEGAFAAAFTSFLNGKEDVGGFDVPVQNLPRVAVRKLLSDIEHQSEPRRRRHQGYSSSCSPGLRT